MNSDSRRILGVSAALVLVAGAAGYGGYQLAARGSDPGSKAAVLRATASPAPADTAATAATPAEAAAATAADTAAPAPATTAAARPATGPSAAVPTPSAPGHERRVLYWYDPMKPDQHFDKPGKSPFMDMELQPQYASTDDGGSGLAIDATASANLGVRFARVERAALAAPLLVPVSVQFNDRLVALVQARSSGFVTRAYPHAPGDVVTAGTPLAEMLLPDWAGAQEEYLAVRRAGDQALSEAARARLRLLGMSEEVIARVEAGGKAEASQVLSAPIDGVIQSLDVRSGMTLAAGAPLARINGIGSVWLEASVPDAQAALIVPGMTLSASFAAFPGETFRARVQSILPEANAEARVLRVRAEVPSRGGRLRPGMFGEAELTAATQAPSLLVPSEAVIRTGTRNLVIVALDGGRYRPVEVRLGREAAGKVTILAGLQEGERVVASGQFLIDSEASLKGVRARPMPAGGTP